MVGPTQDSISRHGNVFYLPQARSCASLQDRRALLAAADLLFVDLSYVMAARLCPGAVIRKLHPMALLDLAPRLRQAKDMKIACSLFGSEIDGFEMIALLNQIGYRGQLIIARPSLPDAQIIRAELGARVQGYRLRLIRDHWLGGDAPDWVGDDPLHGGPLQGGGLHGRRRRAQRLGKAARIGAIPRR